MLVENNKVNKRFMLIEVTSYVIYTNFASGSLLDVSSKRERAAKGEEE